MKVLILAYDFPPYVSVGGLRPYSWYRYLGEFGVEPVVVTRQWSNRYGDERDYIAPSAGDQVEVEASELGTILRTPYAPNLANRLLLAHGPDRFPLLRKLVTGWYEVAQHCTVVGPTRELYRAARHYLAEEGADAVVATAGPFVLLRHASRLAAEFGIPWIADFRDAWSQDLRAGGSRLSRDWEARLERKHTASAAAITTVSDFIGEVMAPLHRGKPIHILPNGYDPEAIATAEGIPQGSEELTIGFVGTVYPWHPMESFLGVASDFVSRTPGVRFRLAMIGVTDGERWQRAVEERFPALAPHVTHMRRLPNAEMAAMLARANALLMFNSYATVGTKIYDYLALKRQILLCYSDDPEANESRRRWYNFPLGPGTDTHAMERIVEEARAGIVVRDAAHLARVLDDLHRELSETGKVACEPVGTERYSRREQARRLSGILADIVDA